MTQATKLFYAKGYQGDENYRTATNKALAGAKALDFLMIDACKNDLRNRLANLNPKSITLESQRYNTKLNLITCAMQTLLFPAAVLVDMGRANRTNQ
jgi:hypothetical protein